MSVYAGYPIILNADHLEFEIAHVNTPPKDRPDWPLPSFNALDWAEHFCKIADKYGFKDACGQPIDEGWMISWFANALMRGYDQRVAEERIRGKLDDDENDNTS
jgi:hypothetical protein